MGWEWLSAGRHKVTGDGWWATLQGNWTRTVEVPESGIPAITYGWYRDFLQYTLDTDWYMWFARIVAVGELLVGPGLIVGLFTGIAAFSGALKNVSYMLAGSASTNPVLFFLAIGIILAWKTAGFHGLDYYVLPRLGTPWMLHRITSRSELQTNFHHSLIDTLTQ